MFTEITETNHNIMCLVGNGFDIAALSWINNILPEDIAKLGLGKNTKSSYEDFYRYIANDINRKTEFKNNLVYQKMEQDYKNFKSTSDENEKRKYNNWSNFEGIVDEMLFGKDPSAIIDIDKINCQKIEEDLLQLQRKFSEFLNDLLPTEKLVWFDRLASEGKYAYRCLQSFLQDFKYHEGDYEIYFPDHIYHHHKLNFLFVDFCYTTLLDSYINLDRNQFVVNKFKKSSNNFDFLPNPDSVFDERLDFCEDTIYQTRLVTQVVHPHGIQSVPRSILFGTEKKDPNLGKGQFTADERWRLIKSLWAQDEEKYLSDIKNTQLFIIFGMSLSSVDGWWMTQIYRQLAPYKTEDIWKKPELIIYNYYANNMDNEKVIQSFIDACIYLEESEKTQKKLNAVKSRIKVITFGDEDRKQCFLGFPDSPENNRKKIKIFKSKRK